MKIDVHNVHLGPDVSEPTVALPSSDEATTKMPSVKQVAFIHFQTSHDRNRARSRNPTLERISVSMRVLIMTGISRTRLTATLRRVPSYQTLHYRYYYFRLQKQPEVLMQSAPTEKWPVHHVWIVGISTEAQRPSGLATVVLKKLQKVHIPEMT